MKLTTWRTRLATIAGAGMMFATPAFAESWIEYRTCEETRSEVLIDGTSTMHDWTVRGRVLEGTVRVGEGLPLEAGEEELKALARENGAKALPVEGKLTIPSRSLRSFRNGRPYSDNMDTIVYEKLQVDAYPEITYELKRLELAETPSKEEGRIALVAEGELSVGGETRSISMPVELRRVDDRRLRLSGTVETKMTDFKIDPPRALAGTIRTGDEITIRVTWFVAREE